MDRRAERGKAAASPSGDRGDAGASDGTMEARAIRRLVEAMPKAELHLHLDGSLRPATALELARTRGIDAPRDFSGMFRALVGPDRCTSQAELLRSFDLPVALLQDAEALERTAVELVEAKAADAVRYAEIRWAPALHTTRGLRLGEVIAAVVTGTRAASARTGTVVRLICTALRSHDPALNVAVAEAAARFRGEGLTGFDLAGQEEAYPDPLAHRRAFEAARASGLRITVHAGEWGGAAQVRRALAVQPERIAHGPGAIDDDALCAEFIARGVTLDLCPTSNVQAGLVPSLADHPLARLHRRGVPVTLSTDDPTVSDITLSEEYLRAIREIGLTLPELWLIDRHALEAAFADESTLTPLRTEFARWAEAVPELAPSA